VQRHEFLIEFGARHVEPFLNDRRVGEGLAGRARGPR
jgi:hypothetical protein